MTQQMIFEQIPKLIADAEAIGKDRVNKQQGFNYRGIDDVMNMVHPLLAKHKVFVTTEVVEEHREQREAKSGGALFYVRLKCLFTFYASDGSNVKSTIIGEAMDSGDKASNKALSIAFKYAMFQLLCIPTEDDPDDVGPEETKVTLNDADRKYVADATASIDEAASVEALQMIGNEFRDKPQRIRDELRPFFTKRMENLRKQEAEDNKSLAVAAGAN